MYMHTRKKSVTFLRDFKLGSLAEILPAGTYEVESEEDVLDEMFLPDCLRTSVLIHLQPTVASPGLSRTLTILWRELEAALIGDKVPSVPSTVEPGINEISRAGMFRQLIYSYCFSAPKARIPELDIRERVLSDA